MLENDVKGLRVLATEHRNTVFEMEDRVASFPEQEQRLTTVLNDLHIDREALRKLPINPERKLPVFKITVGETEYTDRKEERLKVLTDELNQAAIEAKKNAPEREKTCYFGRAKMKRNTARLAKSRELRKIRLRVRIKGKKLNNQL